MHVLHIFVIFGTTTSQWPGSGIILSIKNMSPVSKDAHTIKSQCRRPVTVTVTVGAVAVFDSSMGDSSLIVRYHYSS